LTVMEKQAQFESKFSEAAEADPQEKVSTIMA
jgi:hypothetical protein